MRRKDFSDLTSVPINGIVDAQGAPNPNGTRGSLTALSAINGSQWERR